MLAWILELYLYFTLWKVCCPMFLIHSGYSSVLGSCLCRTGELGTDAVSWRKHKYAGVFAFLICRVRSTRTGTSLGHCVKG